MLSMTEPPDEAGDERTFTISELADTFQVTPRTIRFYEDQGLLSPRRDGLNRVYSHRDRARLTLICRGKRLGFSLAEIKDFLDLYDVDDRQIEQMRFALAHGRERIASLEVQLRDVQQTLSELRALERQIIDHLEAAGAAPDSHTPVKHTPVKQSKK
jgi:DNA-binding transcriptional MerR regulator